MSDNLDSYIQDIDITLGRLRQLAQAEAARHNERLPDVCTCGCESYIEGLRCPDCGYQQEDPKLGYRIVVADEFGFIVCALGRRPRDFTFSTFHIDQSI